MSYYDLDARFVPITVWPGKATTYREKARFKTDRSGTLKLLKRELGMLNAKRIVIQLDMDEKHIRQDGYPKADAVARGPGVIVTFESKFGPLSYPCDTFTRWDDNLRAIALALEALRMVDRYGVTKRGEQYTGWKRLGTGIQPAMSLERAAAFVAGAASTNANRITESGVRLNSEAYRAAYLAAAKTLHPDAGGDTDKFQELQEARRVLDLHHGVR